MTRDAALYAGAGVGAVALAATLVAGWQADSLREAADETHDRSERLLDASEEVVHAVVDTENGQRGLLLTGGQEYLETYQRSVAALPAPLRRLRGEAAGAPAQRQRIADIERLVDTRVTALGNVLAVHRREGLAAAIAAPDFETGGRAMAELRTATQRLEAEAERSAAADEQRALAASVRARTIGSVAVAVLTALLAVLLALIAHRRRLAGRHAAAEAARLRLEDELMRLSNRDPLTGLPNRAMLEDRIDGALPRAARDSTLLAVIFLGLDRFRAVNDSVGRAAGDELLVRVARRLCLELRPTDTLARVGPDQFAALCEGLTSAQHTRATAERLRRAAGSAAVATGEQQVTATASVGIAVADHEHIHTDRGDPLAVTPAKLLDAGESAMLQAKEKGRARTEMFDPGCARHRSRRHELQVDLDAAIADDHGLWIAYQPLIDVDSEEAVGVEALLRWDHGSRGPVPPSEFVPLAEESGQIVPLGRRVLAEACAQAVAWNTRRARLELSPLKMSINVSARQLETGQFAETVDTVLRQTRCSPTDLTLEITESALMDGSRVVARQLEDLADLGVTLALDDFGTGYSSLSYLRRFPIGLIKVDRSFVQGLGRTPADEVIVRAVVVLAHNLGRPALAEGVEHAGQVEHLRMIGCDYGQGFHYGRPAPAAAFDPGTRRMLTHAL